MSYNGKGEVNSPTLRLLATPAHGDIWERHFRGKPERDRLLLALFAYAGLRRSELLGLAWDDVELARRLLYVRRGKGGRQGVVPIHPALAPLFIDYYATRLPLSEQAVFVGIQGKPLNFTQLGQVFRRDIATAGVGERKRVTPPAKGLRWVGCGRSATARGLSMGTCCWGRPVGGSAGCCTILER